MEVTQVELREQWWASSMVGPRPGCTNHWYAREEARFWMPGCQCTFTTCLSPSQCIL